MMINFNTYDRIWLFSWVTLSDLDFFLQGIVLDLNLGEHLMNFTKMDDLTVINILYWEYTKCVEGDKEGVKLKIYLHRAFHHIHMPCLGNSFFSSRNIYWCVRERNMLKNVNYVFITFIQPLLYALIGYSITTKVSFLCPIFFSTISFLHLCPVYIECKSMS